MESKSSQVKENSSTAFFNKLRSSMAMRLRGQLQHLSTEFFDEVDDYFFAHGTQNSLGDDSDFLEAMREFRAKQRLFEDSLINGVLEDFKHLDVERVIESHEEEQVTPESREGAYEIVELDLALQAMVRKSDKFYQPMITQLFKLNDKLQATTGHKVVSCEYLASSLVYEFSQSHQVFSLSLQSRLIFFKLFEKHWLMQLESVFEDIINILNNVIDRRYQSRMKAVMAERERQSNQTRHFSDLHQRRKSIISKPSQQSDAVQAEVDALVQRACDEDCLPPFVDAMIRKNWRAVLFLVGLNRGLTSREWSEARQTLLLLVNLVLKKVEAEAGETANLFQMIRQGFELIRLGKQEQDAFLLELEDLLMREVTSHDQAPDQDSDTTSSRKPGTQEASISPSGENILDKNDLDGIAQLLGDSGGSSASESAENEVADYMPVIEQLPDGSAIEFKFDGQFEACSLERNRQNPSLYTIRRSKTRNPITRSKLGLAISLQEGELRIPCNDSGDLRLQKTVMQKSSARFSRRNIDS